MRQQRACRRRARDLQRGDALNAQAAEAHTWAGVMGLQSDLASAWGDFSVPVAALVLLPAGALWAIISLRIAAARRPWTKVP